MDNAVELNSSCLFCSKITTECDKCCIRCQKRFHLSCIPNPTTVSEQWECELCVQQVDVNKTPPESNPPKTMGHSRKGSRSSKSTAKSELQLEKLSEEKRLKEKTLAKEIELEEQRLALEHRKLARQKAIDEEFIRKKYQVLNEAGSSRSSVTSVNEEDRSEPINATMNWVNQQTTSHLNAFANSFVPPVHHQKGISFIPGYQQEVTLPKTTQCDSGLRSKPSREQLASRSYMGKLPIFSGDPREWFTFISQYERSTLICGFTPDENIVRLQGCIKGEARLQVGTMLTMPDSEGIVIATLKKLYGKPERILQDLLDNIRNFKPIRADDMKTLIEFSIKVNSIYLTIRHGELHDHMSNPLLVAELVRKLPNMLQLFWGGYKSSLPPGESMLPAFNNWLMEYFDIACDIEASCSSKKPDIPSKSKGYLNIHFTESQSKRPCIACKGDCSSIETCPLFLKYSTEERWNCAKLNKLCFRCLTKHWNCEQKNTCGINDCTKKHHKLLHDSTTNSPEIAEFNFHSSPSGTLFRMLPVRLYYNGKSVEVLAFIDEGSSTTLVETDVIANLGVQGKISPLCLKWTGKICRTEAESMQIMGLQISPVDSGDCYHLQSVRTVNKLELPFQELREQEIKNYSHTSELPIIPYAKTRPRLLIGLNNASLVKTIISAEGKLNQPIAAKTKIGWTMYGPSVMGTSDTFSAHICDGDLHNLVKEHFNLESIGVVRTERSSLPSSEKRALELLSTLSIRKGDRFESGLLWRSCNVKIPDTYPMAKQRMECLERRFKREPTLRLAMQHNLDDYESKGYIRKMTKKEIFKANQDCWYLPIFPVVNPNKPEKTRIVWDAAAQVQGISLNSLLLKGPDQLSSLIGVLFRFREFEVAVCGDIEQMFHRILMRQKDQDFQRFLWRKDVSQEFDVYKMTVLTFGASCSPSTAQFIKNKNADDFSTTYPQAAEAIKKNHYVDDYLDSFQTVDEAKKVAAEVKFVHSKGGFFIRNWLSNYNEVVSCLDTDNMCLTKNMSSLSESLDKILGMWWSTDNDCFTYTLRLEKTLDTKYSPTKREILRTIMKVFDPMGLISNVLVFAKILLKKIWRSGTDWDQPILKDHQEMWFNWICILRTVEGLKIPRWHCTTNSSNVQLHVFVDASRDAYAAAAYFRIQSGSSIICSLVFAKTRVSPMKDISIPRLELQAAVLGVRIAKLVTDEHRLKFEKITFWSDSKTVLSWVKNSELRFKQFVSFRVGEILESSNSNQWRYVRSQENIADQATKWVSVPEISEESEWFRGPPFLAKGEEYWPCDVQCEATEEIVNLHTHCTEIAKELFCFERFGNWNRLLRTAATVHRACKIMMKQKIQKTPLTSQELQEAESTIIKLIQKEAFPEEISSLVGKEKNGNVLKNSVLRKLCPFIDDCGVLRANSRLIEGDLEYDVKYPIILPKDSYVTRLIVHYFHERYHHANSKTVINELRQKYQIPKIRVLVNSVRSRCQICKNFNAAPESPRMSCLPAPRVSTHTRPFTFTGVDLFGPLYVVFGRQCLKRWAMLFTCLTVRAVHIEVVHSMSTDSCIQGVMRFMSIRGCPRQLYSDNGTNFRGASNEIKEFLKTLDKDKIQQTFNSLTTEWIFNPPASPHMGGSWERMVQSIKATMKKIRPKRHPTDEMLLTMLAEACNVVNSRPLTYIAVDDESSEAITPNHLLVGSSSGIKPMGTMVDDSDQLRKNWKYVENFANHFWKRFRIEYLPELCNRGKWSNYVNPIKVDDIVYIVDDLSSRNEWTKGRVVEVFKGRNDQVRSCVVQTKSGLITRPAVRLAVLQIHSKLDPVDQLPGGVLVTGDN